MTMDLTGSARMLHSFIKKAATLCLKKKSVYGNPKSKNNFKSKKKFSHQAQINHYNLKKQLSSLATLFSIYPRNPFIRGKYFHLKNNCVSILKKGQAILKENK